MGFLSNLKVKSKFKKGYLADVGEMPDSKDRDRFLVEYAITSNLPIVISEQKRWDELKFVNSNVQIIRLAKAFTFEFKHSDTSDGVLIDETVSIEMITWIREQEIKVCGGFS